MVDEKRSQRIWELQYRGRTLRYFENGEPAPKLARETFNQL
jgi:hypothetical protein